MGVVVETFILFLLFFAEGRKKVKDSKSTVKKKRTHSSEDEAKPAGNGGVANSGTSSGAANSNGKGKNTKKQKVNQEKEGRKGQNKVKSFFHPASYAKDHTFFYFVCVIIYFFLLLCFAGFTFLIILFYVILTIYVPMYLLQTRLQLL